MRSQILTTEIMSISKSQFYYWIELKTQHIIAQPRGLGLI